MPQLLPHRKRTPRRLCLECLEPRLTLSGASIDRGALTYDDGAIGNLPSEFTRDVLTIDDQGIWRGINERRYGTEVDHAPLLDWVEGEVLLATGNSRVLATGWDHDGTTPLLVLQHQTQNSLLIFRGENVELVGSISYGGNGLVLPGAQEYRYVPNAAIVHHGLVVLSAERFEDTGNGYQTVGTTFIHTQNYGVTLGRVEQVGGGFDVPAIAGDASLGMSRGRTWAFLNPFPVEGLGDTTRVWFPWADYIQKSGGPKGGQVGVFQAVRDLETGLWTVLPNRLVYELWIPEDGGGLHAHTAAMTTGGLITHWGDVGYRNQVLFHQFDLSEYQSAPITTQTVYGGYYSSTSIERGAPQPVAAAPSPIVGEHFASGDLTSEVVLQFGALDNSDDLLRISAPVNMPFRNSTGVTYAGADILHLQWVSGIGYVSGSGGNQFLHYSPDGFRWAELNMPPGLGGNAWLYGSSVLTIDGNNRTWRANLPTISSVNPLQIAPGGVNRIAEELPIQSSLGTGNTRRQVEFVEGIWRYVDDLQPLSHQPEPPPFAPTTPVYEVILGSESRDLGNWWLQPEGETLSASEPNLIDVWVYNLGSQTVHLGTRLRVPSAGGSAAATEISYRSNVNYEWVPLGVRQDPSFTGDGRFAVSFLTSRSGSVNADARFLIATPYFGELNTPPYPLDPLASGSNELEVVSGFRLENDWSAGFVFQWPKNAPQSMNGRMPVASLRATDGGYLEFSVEYISSGARVVVEFVRPGQAPVRLNLVHNVLRSDVIEVAVGLQGNQLTATARVGAGQPVSGQISLSIGQSVDFEEFAWASGDGSTVTTVNPMFVMVDDEYAWTAEQQVGWLRSTLEGRPTFRINPYPGDYNFDGVVDEEDLAVWEANVGSTLNLAADGDMSGVIDQADYDIWQQYLGTRAPSPVNPLPGDADFNGLVDIRDFVLWRDTVGSKKFLRADADRNGIVDELDNEIWVGNFGKIIEVPPQPLPGDYNFDGAVNAADYTIWRNTLGSEYILFADGDENDLIEDNDRLFWQSQFGNTLPEEPPEEAATAYAEGAGAAASASVAAGTSEPTDSQGIRSRTTGRGMAQPSENSGTSAARKRDLLNRDTAFAAYGSRSIPTSGRMLDRNYDEDAIANEYLSKLKSPADSWSKLGSINLPSLISAFAELP